jgi:hypothetical protein
VNPVLEVNSETIWWSLRDMLWLQKVGSRKPFEQAMHGELRKKDRAENQNTKVYNTWQANRHKSRPLIRSLCKAYAGMHPNSYLVWKHLGFGFLSFSLSLFLVQVTSSQLFRYVSSWICLNLRSHFLREVSSRTRVMRVLTTITDYTSSQQLLRQKSSRQ